MKKQLYSRKIGIAALIAASIFIFVLPPAPAPAANAGEEWIRSSCDLAFILKFNAYFRFRFIL